MTRDNWLPRFLILACVRLTGPVDVVYELAASFTACFERSGDKTRAAFWTLIHHAMLKLLEQSEQSRDEADAHTDPHERIARMGRAAERMGRGADDLFGLHNDDEDDDDEEDGRFLFGI